MSLRNFVIYIAVPALLALAIVGSLIVAVDTIFQHTPPDPLGLSRFHFKGSSSPGAAIALVDDQMRR